MKRMAAIIIIAMLIPAVATAAALDWFSFNYGSYLGGMLDYTVYEYDGDYYLDAQGMSGVDLSISEKKLDAGQVDELMEIISQCGINSWDGFEQYDEEKPDGDSFTIDISYMNGTRITATGCEKYPDGYWNAWAKLTSFFEKLTA
ncbi:MAG: hypothetical protein Q4D04_01115 [Clostridia bacterium]|nr:hypothetical protein [Clostridia bacterium]